jgi:hypothetical protein
MSLIKRVAQLHIQANKYDRIVYSPKPITSFRNVKQINGSSWAKPKGLWYACGDDWKRFLQSKHPQYASAVYNYKYLLDVNLNRMCVIRTKEEMEEFHRKYSFRAEIYDRVPNAIDWVAVSRDYEGIEICPYQHKFRTKFKKEYSWYSVWDIASGCVWGSSAFKGVTEIDNDIHDGEYNLDSE